jgi:hypothetical protein
VYDIGDKHAEYSNMEPAESSSEVLRKLEVLNMRKVSEERVRTLLSVSDKYKGSNIGSSKGTGIGIGSPLYDCPIEKRYGLGTERTLQAFELMCGVSFSTFSVRERVPPEGVRFVSDDLSGVLNALSQSLSVKGGGATAFGSVEGKQIVEVGKEDEAQTEGAGGAGSTFRKSKGSFAADPGCEASDKALVALSLVQSYLSKK